MEKTFKVIRLEVVENDYIAVSTADCEYSTAFDVHIDGKVICKRTPPYFYFESKEEAIDYLIKKKIQTTSRLHGSTFREESVFKKLDTHKRIKEIKDHYKSVIDKVSQIQLK